MVHAYVTLITATGSSPDVVSRVRELDGVTEAHVVAGEYDVIVEVDAPELRDVLRTVTSGIHGVQGVGTTRTYVALE
jgi:DNA-binding Lrp family transcriptional regulator